MYKEIDKVWMHVEGETTGFVAWTLIASLIGSGAMFLAVAITNAVLA